MNKEFIAENLKLYKNFEIFALSFKGESIQR